MQVFPPPNNVPPLPLPSSYSALIPGPFILLLLLPSIPLLLFSIGARPPDTSALPFSATEVFTTAAFVSIAGGVVLALVVWPELGKDLGGWVGASGKGDVGNAGQVGLWERVKALSGRGGSGQIQRGSGGYMAQYSNRAGQAQYQQFVGTARNAAVKGVPKTQAGRAAARLYAIRSTFIHLYNPARPHMPTALFITCILLVVLVIAAGNFIRAIYELDGSSPSSSSSSRSNSGPKTKPDTGKDGADLTPWVMSEIKKRQSELKAGKSPQQTLERFQKEAEGERKQMKDKVEHLGPEKGKEYRERKEKERGKELGMLKGRLEKLGLTTVGVEGADQVNAKAEGESRGEEAVKEADEGEEGGSGDGGTGGIGKKWKLWSRNSKAQGKEKKESVPFSERFKRAIVPVPLSSVNETNGLTKASAKRDLELLMNGGTVPARGPGWEVADDTQANAALAKSASNAENLAAKMKV